MARKVGRREPSKRSSASSATNPQIAVVRTNIAVEEKEIIPWKEWALIFISAPASLGLLAQIDKRLSFGPLLERAILGYKNVSEAAWSTIAQYVGFTLPLPHTYLTFLSLTFPPALWFVARRWSKIFAIEGSYWPSNGKSLFTVHMAAFLLMIAFDDIFLQLWAPVVLVTYALFIYVDKINEIRLETLSFPRFYNFIILIYASFAIYLTARHMFQESPLSSSEVFFGIATQGVVFAIFQIAMIVGLRSLLYVTLVASGVFFVDHVSKWIIPGLDIWLTSIGA